MRGRRGKFEHADGGTLFLDEVSDLSLSAQAKLLRAIQDLAVERVGGNGTPSRRHPDRRRDQSQPARAWSSSGLFRADLFYRLSGVDIRVPPLRERRDDILELAQYFLERHRATRPLRLSAAAVDALMAYDWPGNVRELERMIERAVALAESTSSSSTICRSAVRGDYAEHAGAVAAARTTRCARGAAATRGWCSSAAAATSARPAGVLDISYHTLNAYLTLPAAGNASPARDRPGRCRLRSGI